MLEQLSAGEVEAMLSYIPDREPTRAELQELERQVPSRRTQMFCMCKEDPIEWVPKKKIILSEEINRIWNYKRVIFNDGETIVDLEERTPLRIRKKDTIIKLKSELGELYQDLRFIRKQQQQWPTLQHRQKLRLIMADKSRHITKLDWLLKIVYKI